MSATHRILLLGATGPTGRQIARQALARGHSVTAVARRAAQLEIQDPRLTPVAADLAADAVAIEKLTPGHDVIVSALGVGRALRSDGLMTKVTSRLVAAMERHGVRRLVFLSAYGVGGTAPQAPLMYRLMFGFMLSDIYADKAAAEILLRASALDWTIFAPVILSNGAPRGHYRMGENLAVRGFARIARADVADAMLHCLDDATSVHRRYIIAP